MAAASAHRISGTQRRLGFTSVEISAWTGKPPALNKYGRDSDSPSERERERTNWLKSDAAEFTGKGDFTGYTPMPHSWYADIARITRGKAQVLLLLYAWSQSYGHERRAGEDPPEWTGDLKVKHLSNILRCTEKQVFDDLADAKERKVIDLRRPSAGVVRLRLRFRGWEALPDYEAPVKPAAAAVADEPAAAAVADEPAAAAVADEPAATTDEQMAISKEPVVLLKRPAFIRAGQSSRPVQVTTGVKAFRLVNECNAGLGLDAVVIAGELQLTTRFQNTRPIEINHLVAKNGSTLPKPETGPRTSRPPVAMAPKNGRSSNISNLASKNGSTLPKNGNERLAELTAGLRDPRRGLAVADDHAALVLREIGSLSLSIFFQTLDGKILKAAARHEHYNPAWLIRTAKDAVSTWSAVEKAAPQPKGATETPTDPKRIREAARRVLANPEANNKHALDWAREVLAEGRAD